MRVYALAKELGIKSAELVERLQAMGLGVTAPSSSITEAEAGTARAAYAAAKGGEASGGESGPETDDGAAGGDEAVAPEGTPESGDESGAETDDEVERAAGPALRQEDNLTVPAQAPPGGGEGWRLLSKGSVQVPEAGVKCRKGETISHAAYRRLPARVRPFFELDT